MWARPLWALFGLFIATDKFNRLIDVSGIVVFVGPNGAGKSLAAVHTLLPALDGIAWECVDLDHAHNSDARVHINGCAECRDELWRFFTAETFPDVGGYLCADGSAELAGSCTGERLVYSTVRLLGPDGREHPRFRALTDYRQLLTIEHADVLFDEVAGVSDASDSASVPVQVIRWMHTLRKSDVRLRVTTPAYSRCSKPVRQVTQIVVDCRAYFAEVATTGRLWRPRRAFRFTAYDAFEFEDFTSATRRAEGDSIGRKAKKATGLLWRPGCLAQRTYNTLGQVLALGHVTESGMCSVCGGSRPRPRCGCPEGIDQEPGDVVVVEKVTASGARIRTGTAVPAPAGRRRAEIA